MNLAKNGFKVFPYDVKKSNLDVLKGNNIHVASSLKEVAEHCQHIVFMLPNAQVSRDVLDEISTYAKKGTSFIESSTIES